MKYIGFICISLFFLADSNLSEKNLCGDLLQNYAQKPKSLEFIKCKKVSDSQTIVRAEYRVSGKEAKAVEDFLVENYGMGKLKFACCGWESQSSYGNFNHEKLLKIDKYLSGIISMYASAEIDDPNAPNGVRLEFDKNKRKLFVIH